MPSESAHGKHLILYDGVCGLCNRLNQFVLRRDRDDRFRFAALQGEVSAQTLARHGCDPRELDTVYLVLHWGTADERVLKKALAILRVLRELGGLWRGIALLRVLPRVVLDLGYDLVARRRYRWFGQYPACPVPPPGQQQKFVD